MTTEYWARLMRQFHSWKFSRSVCFATSPWKTRNTTWTKLLPKSTAGFKPSSTMAKNWLNNERSEFVGRRGHEFDSTRHALSGHDESAPGSRHAARRLRDGHS